MGSGHNTHNIDISAKCTSFKKIPRFTNYFRVPNIPEQYSAADKKSVKIYKRHASNLFRSTPVCLITFRLSTSTPLPSEDSQRSTGQAEQNSASVESVPARIAKSGRIIFWGGGRSVGLQYFIKKRKQLNKFQNFLNWNRRIWKFTYNFVFVWWHNI